MTSTTRICFNSDPPVDMNLLYGLRQILRVEVEHTSCPPRFSNSDRIFLTEVQAFIHLLEIALLLGIEVVRLKRSIMKKISLFAVALVFTSALAQSGIAPKAADLLEKAKAAHGGAALEKLMTYRDVGTYTVYQNGALAGELQATQVIDFAGERVRIELKVGDSVAQILQTTPQDAWSWTSASGTVKLPATQAKPIRDGLYQALFGLRLGGKNRDSATADGLVDFGDGIKGESVSVVTKGASAKYVFDETGTWIGGKDISEGQELLSAQSDFRVQDGIKIPFISKTTIAGQPYIDVQLSKVEINPTLSDSDFAAPKQ